MDSLDELYRYLRWPMDPGDPEALKRYEAILQFFSGKLGGEIPLHGDATILDVAAGTGIAGVALAEALTRHGVRVEKLTVTDVREDDLDRARAWLGERGLDIDLETVKVDARRLVEELDGRYTYILLWGSTLPHFSTWDYTLIAAGTRELIEERGVFIVEQRDLLPRILHTNTYHHIHVAPGRDEGVLVISVLAGYDEFTGMETKQQYLAPGLHYLGKTYTKLWDAATMLTITWLFYSRVDLSKNADKSVVIATNPRRHAPSARELQETLPSQAKPS